MNRLLLLFILLFSATSMLFAQTFTDVSGQLSPIDPPGNRVGQRGSSAADFNNDGLVDLYHANFRDPGRLYLNQGDGTFLDVLERLDIDEGENMWGAAFGDYNDDGYLDILFEDLSEPSLLYKNRRSGMFELVNDEANVDILTLAQGAAWDDFNLDGKLDFFIVNDIGPNQLFKNIDRISFEDISIAAGVQTIGNSYGVSWGDINNDGYPDAYIATCHPSDPLRSINHLLLNNGDETFTNIGQASGTADSLAGWAVLMTDYDADNDFDIFVTNSVHDPRPGDNRLYRNNGDNTFTNMASFAGVGALDENSFGAAVADFDNDGWEDLYVTNVDHPDRLFRNNGDGTYSDIAAAAGIPANNHRTVSVADLDNDGWIDIFTAGAPENKLLMNNGGSNHWLRLRCRGISNNYHGVGTRIELFIGAQRQLRAIRAGDSFCSQNLDLMAHFGLGTATTIDSIIFYWPNGVVDKLYDLQDIDQEITMIEGSSLNHRPTTFALLSPADGDTLAAGNDDVVFHWENAADSDGETISYSLFLTLKDLLSNSYRDTSFSNISDTFLAVNREVIPPNHAIYWSADASDGTQRTAAKNPRVVYSENFSLFSLSAIVIGDPQFPSTGTSWMDYDSDGLVDLYVTNASNKRNQLYRNNGGGTFTEITSGTVVNDADDSFGAVWGDYNRDNYPDLFVANVNGQNNRLYMNNGDGTFSSNTVALPANEGGNTLSGSWADYDNDGWLDLLAANGSNNANFLYHNDGTGNFSKISSGAIATDARNAFGAVWADYDNDGFVDLFVANSQTNDLYRNNGNGTFTAVSNSPVVTDAAISLSGSWGDYDNDGDPDLFVANFSFNFFYENNGDGTFTKISNSIPTSDAFTSRSGTWADFDNDGDLDLIVSNEATNSFYLNNGDKTFSRVEIPGFNSSPTSSNAISTADIDNDGDLDIAVALLSESDGNQLFINNSFSNNWLKVSLRGTLSNANGFGAKVRLQSRPAGISTWQLREISSQSNFAAQNSPHAHFGLGSASIVDSLIVQWPSGKVNRLGNLSVNQTISVVEDSTTAIDDPLSGVPGDYMLSQNYPNPFNPNTNIGFQLSDFGFVELLIYDINGRLVKTLVKENRAAGNYSEAWNATNDLGESVGSGIYFYQIKVNHYREVRKMILLK